MVSMQIAIIHIYRSDTMKGIFTYILIFVITCWMFISLLINHQRQQIDFIAVGDNLIHPVVYQDANNGKDSYNFQKMYRPIAPYIQDKDLAYINQESPLGGDDRPFSGFKRFNTPSVVAKAVIDTGFNLINGSNNHSLDQGTSGINNSLSTWHKYQDKALFTGMFKSKNDYNKTPTINIKNTKVSMLSYTFGTNNLTPKSPYQIKYINKQQIKRDIKKAKQHSDFIVISMHWGKEGSHKPSKKQKEYAKFLAKQNVDVVIGMHPHVIQPVEWVKGTQNHKTLVAYSLGNFLNGQETGTESNHLGGSIQFKIANNHNDTKISDVKWRSIVNHYEMTAPYNNDSRHHFKVYMLNDYPNKLADQHGLQYQRNTNMSKSQLQQITTNVIDKRFLDNNSY